MKTKTWDIHTDNSKEALTFVEIVERCPGIAADTLRSRLRRGVRSLPALTAKAETKQQIAKRTRESLRRSGYDKR
jgi:hypothetical protein